MQGAFAGYGATLICDTSYTCYVECYGNNCNNLTLTENGGAFSVTCYYDARKSDACSNGKQLSSFMDKFQMPTLTNLEMTSGDYECDYSNNPNRHNTMQ